MASFDDIEIVGEVPPQVINEMHATGAYMMPSVSDGDTESRTTTPEQRDVEASATRAVDRSARNGNDMRAASQQLRAVSQQLRGHAAFEGTWQEAVPSADHHDCTARLSAQRTTIGGNGERPGTSRRSDVAPSEIRPTVRRRLNALAIMVSDGCAHVRPGFQHTNLAMIDNLLHTANTLLSTAYDLMDLVNELNVCENCRGNRCPLCTEQIVLD